MAPQPYPRVAIGYPRVAVAVADNRTIIVANVASRGWARHFHINGKVCLSFIDVFAQKGFKVYGVARDVKPSETEYFRWAEPLRMMVGDRFPIHSVFLVRATAVEPIIAPSYRLYPSETTEASQVQAALCTYGVRREGSNV